MLSLWRFGRSRANPKNRFARLLHRGDAANAARDWARAEAAYAAALCLDPARGDVRVQYGHCLKEQGRTANAAAAYRQALDDGAAPDAAVHLADLLERQGDVDEARAVSAPRAPAPLRDLADEPPRTSRDEAAAASRIPLAVSPPATPVRHPAPIAFLHLNKTGGLTFHRVLARPFRADRICPVRDDHLHLHTRAELDGFDLFSGHFDIGAVDLLRRPGLRLVSLFREPCARLVSFYRFHAGHDLGARHGVNLFVRLANAMPVEDFFEDERVRQAPQVFNHYLVVFGLGYAQAQRRGLRNAEVPEALVERAVARVRGLDAIGLTERFDESVALACSTLGLAAPAPVKPRNVTDVLATKMRGDLPPRVAMTPRLAAALADLVRADTVIYAAAVAEFERRLSERRPPA